MPKMPKPVHQVYNQPVRIALAPWEGATEPCVIENAELYRQTGESPLKSRANCPWVGKEAYLLDLLLEAAKVPVEFVFYGENGTDVRWGMRNGSEWTGLIGDMMNGTVDMIGAAFGSSVLAGDDRFFIIYPVGGIVES